MTLNEENFTCLYTAKRATDRFAVEDARSTSAKFEGGYVHPASRI